MWPITLSGRLLIVDLVGRYLTNYLIRREPTSHRIPPFTSTGCPVVVLCGISTSFDALSPCMGQIIHALLTRPPLGYIRASSPATSFDLHVLSTPPAFVLSQDQTLVFNPLTCYLQGFCPNFVSSIRTLQSQAKLISELTVVKPQSLCIVFKILAPSAQSPSLERLVRIPQIPLHCQQFF